MTLEEALERLEALGTEQNRKVYARHGVRTPQYGVSFTHLRALQKEIRTDHTLAQQLWATGNHDARVLATLVADPSQMDDTYLQGWLDDLDDYILTDSFSGLAARLKTASASMTQWMDDDREFVGQAGWNLVAHLALNDDSLEDDFFAALLPRIEARIHQAQNRVRHAMNQALIAIGTRSDALEELAVAAAERIGPVEVNHGETGCKTPAAAPYIRKARAHRRQKKLKAKRS